MLFSALYPDVARNFAAGQYSDLGESSKVSRSLVYIRISSDRCSLFFAVSPYESSVRNSSRSECRFDFFLLGRECDRSLRLPLGGPPRGGGLLFSPPRWADVCCGPFCWAAAVVLSSAVGRIFLTARGDRLRDGDVRLRMSIRRPCVLSAGLSFPRSGLVCSFRGSCAQYWLMSAFSWF